MVRFYSICDVADQDGEGNIVIVKKDVRIATWIDPANITQIEQLVSRAGRVYKKRCKVYLDVHPYETVLCHSPKEVDAIRKQHVLNIKVKGYKRYDVNSK